MGSFPSTICKASRHTEEGVSEINRRVVEGAVVAEDGELTLGGDRLRHR